MEERMNKGGVDPKMGQMNFMASESELERMIAGDPTCGIPGRQPRGSAKDMYSGQDMNFMNRRNFVNPSRPQPPPRDNRGSMGSWINPNMAGSPFMSRMSERGNPVGDGNDQMNIFGSMMMPDNSTGGQDGSQFSSQNQLSTPKSNMPMNFGDALFGSNQLGQPFDNVSGFGAGPVASNFGMMNSPSHQPLPSLPPSIQGADNTIANLGLFNSKQNSQQFIESNDVMDSMFSQPRSLDSAMMKQVAPVDMMRDSQRGMMNRNAQPEFSFSAITMRSGSVPDFRSMLQPFSWLSQMQMSEPAGVTAFMTQMQVIRSPGNMNREASFMQLQMSHMTRAPNPFMDMQREMYLDQLMHMQRMYMTNMGNNEQNRALQSQQNLYLQDVSNSDIPSNQGNVQFSSDTDNEDNWQSENFDGSSTGQIASGQGGWPVSGTLPSMFDSSDKMKMGHADQLDIGGDASQQVSFPSFSSMAQPMVSSSGHVSRNVGTPVTSISAQMTSAPLSPNLTPSGSSPGPLTPSSGIMPSSSVRTSGPNVPLPGGGERYGRLERYRNEAIPKQNGSPDSEILDIFKFPPSSSSSRRQQSLSSSNIRTPSYDTSPFHSPQRGKTQESLPSVDSMHYSNGDSILSNNVPENFLSPPNRCVQDPTSSQNLQMGQIVNSGDGLHSNKSMSPTSVDDLIKNYELGDINFVEELSPAFNHIQTGSLFDKDLKEGSQDSMDGQNLSNGQASVQTSNASILEPQRSNIPVSSHWGNQHSLLGQEPLRNPNSSAMSHLGGNFGPQDRSVMNGGLNSNQQSYGINNFEGAGNPMNASNFPMPYMFNDLLQPSNFPQGFPESLISGTMMVGETGQKKKRRSRQKSASDDSAPPKTPKPRKRRAKKKGGVDEPVPNGSPTALEQNANEGNNTRTTYPTTSENQMENCPVLAGESMQPGQIVATIQYGGRLIDKNAEPPVREGVACNPPFQSFIASEPSQVPHFAAEQDMDTKTQESSAISRPLSCSEGSCVPVESHKVSVVEERLSKTSLKDSVTDTPPSEVLSSNFQLLSKSPEKGGVTSASIVSERQSESMWAPPQHDLGNGSLHASNPFDDFDFDLNAPPRRDPLNIRKEPEGYSIAKTPDVGLPPSSSNNLSGHPLSAREAKSYLAESEDYLRSTKSSFFDSSFASTESHRESSPSSFDSHISVIQQGTKESNVITVPSLKIGQGLGKKLIFAKENQTVKNLLSKLKSSFKDISPTKGVSQKDPSEEGDKCTDAGDALLGDVSHEDTENLQVNESAIEKVQDATVASPYNDQETSGSTFAEKSQGESIYDQLPLSNNSQTTLQVPLPSLEPFQGMEARHSNSVIHSPSSDPPLAIAPFPSFDSDDENSDSLNPRVSTALSKVMSSLFESRSGPLGDNEINDMGCAREEEVGKEINIFAQARPFQLPENLDNTKTSTFEDSGLHEYLIPPKLTTSDIPTIALPIQEPNRQGEESDGIGKEESASIPGSSAESLYTASPKLKEKLAFRGFVGIVPPETLGQDLGIIPFPNSNFSAGVNSASQMKDHLKGMAANQSVITLPAAEETPRASYGATCSQASHSPVLSTIDSAQVAEFTHSDSTFEFKMPKKEKKKKKKDLSEFMKIKKRGKTKLNEMEGTSEETEMLYFREKVLGQTTPQEYFQTDPLCSVVKHDKTEKREGNIPIFGGINNRGKDMHELEEQALKARINAIRSDMEHLMSKRRSNSSRKASGSGSKTLKSHKVKRWKVEEVSPDDEEEEDPLAIGGSSLLIKSPKFEFQMEFNTDSSSSEQPLRAVIKRIGPSKVFESQIEVCSPFKSGYLKDIGEGSQKNLGSVAGPQQDVVSSIPSVVSLDAKMHEMDSGTTVPMLQLQLERMPSSTDLHEVVHIKKKRASSQAATMVQFVAEETIGTCVQGELPASIKVRDGGKNLCKEVSSKLLDDVIQSKDDEHLDSEILSDSNSNKEGETREAVVLHDTLRRMCPDGVQDGSNAHGSFQDIKGMSSEVGSFSAGGVGSNVIAVSGHVCSESLSSVIEDNQTGISTSPSDEVEKHDVTTSSIPTDAMNDVLILKGNKTPRLPCTINVSYGKTSRESQALVSDSSLPAGIGIDSFSSTLTHRNTGSTESVVRASGRGRGRGAKRGRKRKASSRPGKDHFTAGTNSPILSPTQLLSVQGEKDSPTEMTCTESTVVSESAYTAEASPVYDIGGVVLDGPASEITNCLVGEHKDEQIEQSEELKSQPFTDNTARTLMTEDKLPYSVDLTGNSGTSERVDKVEWNTALTEIKKGSHNQSDILKSAEPARVKHGKDSPDCHQEGAAKLSLDQKGPKSDNACQELSSATEAYSGSDPLLGYSITKGEAEIVDTAEFEGDSKLLRSKKVALEKCYIPLNEQGSSRQAAEAFGKPDRNDDTPVIRPGKRRRNRSKKSPFAKKKKRTYFPPHLVQLVEEGESQLTAQNPNLSTIESQLSSSQIGKPDNSSGRDGKQEAACPCKMQGESVFRRSERRSVISATNSADVTNLSKIGTVRVVENQRNDPRRESGEPPYKEHNTNEHGAQLPPEQTGAAESAVRHAPANKKGRRAGGKKKKRKKFWFPGQGLPQKSPSDAGELSESTQSSEPEVATSNVKEPDTDVKAQDNNGSIVRVGFENTAVKVTSTTKGDVFNDDKKTKLHHIISKDADKVATEGTSAPAVLDSDESVLSKPIEVAPQEHQNGISGPLFPVPHHGRGKKKRQGNRKGRKKTKCGKSQVTVTAKFQTDAETTDPNTTDLRLQSSTNTFNSVSPVDQNGSAKKGKGHGCISRSHELSLLGITSIPDLDTVGVGVRTRHKVQEEKRSVNAASESNNDAKADTKNANKNYTKTETKGDGKDDILEVESSTATAPLTEIQKHETKKSPSKKGRPRGKRSLTPLVEPSSIAGLDTPSPAEISWYETTRRTRSSRNRPAGLLTDIHGFVEKARPQGDTPESSSEIEPENQSTPQRKGRKGSKVIGAITPQEQTPTSTVTNTPTCKKAARGRRGSSSKKRKVATKKSGSSAATTAEVERPFAVKVEEVNSDEYLAKKRRLDELLYKSEEDSEEAELHVSQDFSEAKVENCGLTGEPCQEPIVPKIESETTQVTEETCERKDPSILELASPASPEEASGSPSATEGLFKTIELKGERIETTPPSAGSVEGGSSKKKGVRKFNIDAICSKLVARVASGKEGEPSSESSLMDANATLEDSSLGKDPVKGIGNIFEKALSLDDHKKISSDCTGGVLAEGEKSQDGQSQTCQLDFLTAQLSAAQESAKDQGPPLVPEPIPPGDLDGLSSVTSPTDFKSEKKRPGRKRKESLSSDSTKGSDPVFAIGKTELDDISPDYTKRQPPRRKCSNVSYIQYLESSSEEEEQVARDPYAGKIKRHKKLGSKRKNSDPGIQQVNTMPADKLGGCTRQDFVSTRIPSQTKKGVCEEGRKGTKVMTSSAVISSQQQTEDANKNVPATLKGETSELCSKDRTVKPPTKIRIVYNKGTREIGHQEAINLGLKILKGKGLLKTNSSAEIIFEEKSVTETRPDGTPGVTKTRVVKTVTISNISSLANTSLDTSSFNAKITVSKGKSQPGTVDSSIPTGTNHNKNLTVLKDIPVKKEGPSEGSGKERVSVGSVPAFSQQELKKTPAASVVQGSSLPPKGVPVTACIIQAGGARTVKGNPLMISKIPAKIVPLSMPLRTQPVTSMEKGILPLGVKTTAPTMTISNLPFSSMQKSSPGIPSLTLPLFLGSTISNGVEDKKLPSPGKVPSPLNRSEGGKGIHVKRTIQNNRNTSNISLSGTNLNGSPEVPELAATKEESSEPVTVKEDNSPLKCSLMTKGSPSHLDHLETCEQSTALPKDVSVSGKTNFDCSHDVAQPKTEVQELQSGYQLIPSGKKTEEHGSICRNPANSADFTNTDESQMLSMAKPLSKDERELSATQQLGSLVCENRSSSPKVTIERSERGCSSLQIPKVVVSTDRREDHIDYMQKAAERVGEAVMKTVEENKVEKAVSSAGGNGELERTGEDQVKSLDIEKSRKVSLIEQPVPKVTRHQSQTSTFSNNEREGKLSSPILPSDASISDVVQAAPIPPGFVSPPSTSPKRSLSHSLEIENSNEAANLSGYPQLKDSKSTPSNVKVAQKQSAWDESRHKEKKSLIASLDEARIHLKEVSGAEGSLIEDLKDKGLEPPELSSETKIIFPDKSSALEVSPVHLAQEIVRLGDSRSVDETSPVSDAFELHGRGKQQQEQTESGSSNRRYDQDCDQVPPSSGENSCPSLSRPSSPSSYATDDSNPAMDVIDNDVKVECTLKSVPFNCIKREDAKSPPVGRTPPDPSIARAEQASTGSGKEKQKRKTLTLAQELAMKRTFGSAPYDARDSQKVAGKPITLVRKRAQRKQNLKFEYFLQEGSCKATPKLPRCRDCRNPDHDVNFCRFSLFRRMRKNIKTGKIDAAGFCRPDQVVEEDYKPWKASKNVSVDFEMCKYIIEHVGGQFCEVVEEEYRAVTWGSKDGAVAWKRAVGGVREMCDACATTIFNIHWVCEKCGFGVCLDCYRMKLEDKMKAENADGNKKSEVFRWVSCAPGLGHKPESLTVTQIIPLSELWDLCRDLVKTSEELGIRFSLPEKPFYQTFMATYDARESFELKGEDTTSSETEPSSSGLCSGLSEGSNLAELKVEGELASVPDSKQLSNDSPCQSAERTPSDKFLDSRTPDVTEGMQIKAQSSAKTNTCGDDRNIPTENSDYKLLVQKARNVINSIEKWRKEFKAVQDSCGSSNVKMTKKERADSGNGTGKSIDEGARPLSNLDILAMIATGIDSKVKKENDVCDDRHIPATVGEPSDLTNYPTKSSRSSPVGAEDEGACIYDYICENKMVRLKHPHDTRNHEIFREHWIKGEPILVSNVNHLLDADIWHPQAFAKEFGGETADVVNCRTHQTMENFSVAEFWIGFEKVSERPVDNLDRPMLLKLKDWPPGADFSEKLPTRFTDLMNALPVPEYTQRDGVWNLISRLPQFFVKPDLGPKMYNAYGSASVPSAGTTNLHLDMSDAVNVMVYVGLPKEEDFRVKESIDTLKAVDIACDETTRKRVRNNLDVPGALWHIYAAEDANKIRDFLRKVQSERRKAKVSSCCDPIHDQSIYLDHDLRTRLKEEYGVTGYAICQCLGDAVFIPAGAPHQVLNLHSCVKVAEDFVSPEHVGHCFKLTQEFRYLSDKHTNHEDKLQVKNIIYHAVKDSVAVMKNRLHEQREKELERLQTEC